MLVFPQLATGAAALYPVTRKYAARTVLNALGDGSTVVFADPDGATREWNLRATGLTLDEWTAIETLFQAVSGSFTVFTFLDPAGNLLLRSEEFGEPEWDNGPLIQLTPGIADPLGTMRATRVINAGSVAGAVAQALVVPGNFRYALSVWAKTTGGSNVTLSATTAGGNAAQNFALTSQWRRTSLEVGLGLNTDSVVFGAQLEAGASVDLFGMQVEAQRGLSDYKKTGGSGGLYGNARFAEDELTVTARGTDMFDAVVRIVSS
jgi:class 3 adenylate cyclase